MDLTGKCKRCGEPASYVDDLTGDEWCKRHAGPLAWSDRRVNAYEKRRVRALSMASGLAKITN